MRCREKELAYTQAMALYTSQAWMEAIPAFDALGDYRDSAARLLACRSNLYRAAEPPPPRRPWIP